MKKLLTIMLALVMSLSVATLFTACEETPEETHVHTYASEWTSDVTHHWKKANCEHTEEVAEKAEHTWNDGEITTEATETATGEKTITCTVCGATKNEAVEFEGVKQEVWKEYIAEQNFDNVTISYSTVNESVNGIHTVKIVGDKVYRKVEQTMVGQEPIELELYLTGEDAKVQKKMYLDMFLALINERDNFKYDKEQKVYVLDKEVKQTLDGGQGMTSEEIMNVGKVKFNSAGKLENFECVLKESVYEGENLINSATYNVLWSFSNYGSTVIE